ncbi:unnamed protein product [Brassica rapa]|uniref:Uncharacterized protein n=1 Tax=Brassica campestris TaxID=3711 RepID=A0A3P5Y293_BRACM|nr:unnamed protein product [Brassica rapa]VDC61256.1 unnamed protein product [Brassica rapa]
MVGELSRFLVVHQHHPIQRALSSHEMALEISSSS